MSRKQQFQIGLLGGTLLIAGILVVGCGGTSSTPAAAGAVGSDTYSSAYLDTSYDNALPASSQLVLGTLKLEGTGNAVTPQQAKTLLPLWQAISGGALKDETEIDAVLKQIEGTMTKEQMTAIGAMRLTSEDMRAWMQEQGANFAPPAGQEGAYPTPGAGQGWLGPSGTPGAGPGWPGASGTPNQEEWAARRATAEAGGMAPSGGRGFGAGVGQSNFLVRPLIELLTKRAAEGS